MRLPPEQRPDLKAFLMACEAVRAEGLERAGKRSGCALREARFEVEFLGRTYLLRAEPPSVEPEAADRDKACIARYVMLARPLVDVTPVGFADVPRARGYLGPFKGRVLGAFLGVFGRAPEKLARAAQSLAGERAPYGDEAWTLRVFPLVDLSFVLHPGDEELEPEATVLFPRGLFDVFEVEDAVVMAELASRALRRAASR